MRRSNRNTFSERRISEGALHRNETPAGKQKNRKKDDSPCIGGLTILLSPELDVEEKKRRLSQEYGIEMTTEMEKEATDMCDYSKMIKDQGRKEGIKEGKKEGIELGQWTAIQSLMKTMHMPLEQAMDVLLIPEAMRMKYRARQ